MSKPIITVIGSFAVGMTLRTTHMPVFGETLLGRDFDMGPGGKGSNQAVGVARLGAEAHFASIIGRDKLGEIATDLYSAESVHTDHVQLTDAASTGAGFIILNEAGENGIILDMGANDLMDAAFVDTVEAQIKRSDLVLSVLEIPAAAAMQAMRLGKKHGVPTILNPAPAQALDSADFGNIDYLTPNETELRILLGRKPNDPAPTLDLAHQLRAKGVGNLIVTRGGAGAMIVSDDGVQTVPSISVDVVDTTGAGDAFTAGLAVALAEGRTLHDAVQFAVCSGAIACTALGVIPSLAQRTQVDELYKTQFI